MTDPERVHCITELGPTDGPGLIVVAVAVSVWGSVVWQPIWNGAA